MATLFASSLPSFPTTTATTTTTTTVITATATHTSASTGSIVSTFFHVASARIRNTTSVGASTPRSKLRLVSHLRSSRVVEAEEGRMPWAGLGSLGFEPLCQEQQRYAA